MNEMSPVPSEGIGARVKRKEDLRFLTGMGRYVDDMNRPGQAHAVIVRSPFAHANVKGIDASAAKAMDGVIAVYTAADMAGLGTLPCGWQVTGKDGQVMVEPPHPLLTDVARHVGDPVAMVVAEAKAIAKDAAEALYIDYDEQPSITSTAVASDAGQPQVWADAPSNQCYDWELGDQAATDAAFANAHHVTKLDLVNTRLVPNAMEPRAAVGEYERATDQYTLYTTSQNPHVIRLLMGAFVLQVPEHKLRVVAPDVGGGFGSKIYHYAEEALVTWASKQLHRPVKWTADRSESFISDAHGRDHITHAELAMDADGKFLGLRVSTVANMGAYLSTFAPAIPTYLYGTLLSGQYTTPAIYVETKAVFTHTTPVDAYRGAGRPEACYLIERIIDNAAREMGIDRAELRRRNMIPKEAMPYQTPVAVQYDSGDFAQCLDRALEMIDYAGFEARRAEAASRGKLRGIGFASYIEACGIAPSKLVGQLGARAGLYESGEVRFHPTGSVSVFTGTHSHGQGHETAFAQLISDRFGIPVDNVEVVHGDTANVAFGMGTYGSRSIAVGGAAIVKAMDKVVDKSKKIAAHLMEASVEDIEFDKGAFRVSGTDKQVGIGDIAMAAYVPHNYPIEEVEPGLDESAFYDPLNFTYPNGTQIAEVEIDPDTGVTKLLRFVCVDDFGIVVNPMLVEGQVHGGVAQGIGQALLENAVYDPASGQLLSGSYMDYTMPRADDLCSFEVDYHEDAPCTHNPLGVKGAGEAGCIGGAATVMNAVVDALSVKGVKHMDMPATPVRVWNTIKQAG